MKIGLDVGSTTIKCVVLDDADNIVYSTYERHFSHILEKSEELLRRVAGQYVPSDKRPGAPGAGAVHADLHAAGEEEDLRVLAPQLYYHIGVAQGRPIKGNVLYLGGPLTFSKCLRESFDKTLGVAGTCPENSLLFVALGAAFYADQSFDLSARSRWW